MALVVAHIDLAKAEAAAIAGQVGRVIALGALAFILVVFAVFLFVIGVSLGIGEWVFGSMGWGVIHGVELFLSVAMAAVLLAHRHRRRAGSCAGSPSPSSSASSSVWRSG